LNDFSFHDASLVSARMDWDPPTAALRVSPYPGPSPHVFLVGWGVRSLVVPRLDEWGPSVSINDVTFEVHDGLSHIEVEIQSGDVVVLDAVRTAIVQFSIVGVDRASGEPVEEQVFPAEIDVLMKLVGSNTLAELVDATDVRIAGDQLDVARLLGQELSPDREWTFSARHVEDAFGLRSDAGRLMQQV
jgi:hypothetical protein